MENHQTLQEIFSDNYSQRILAYNTGTIILKQWPDIIPIYWEF